ncbi:MAG: hypothetical protein ACOX8E_08195 [Ruminococcus sp.]
MAVKEFREPYFVIVFRTIQRIVPKGKEAVNEGIPYEVSAKSMEDKLEVTSVGAGVYSAAK